jgi:hypothetical protein
VIVQQERAVVLHSRAGPGGSLTPGLIRMACSRRQTWGVLGRFSALWPGPGEAVEQWQFADA